MRIRLCIAVAALAISPFLSPMASATDAPVKLSPGDAPPALMLGHTRRGEEIGVDKAAGTVRVVTFWASWCGPCRQEIVMLNELAEVAPDKLKVVAADIEEWQTFKEVTKQFFESKVIYANDRSRQARKAYGVNGIPHMVIIGKDGKVVSVKRGYSEESLPGLLKEIEVEMGRG
jgi:thiol-disulfide isomerase/thioredoxin